MNINWQSIKEKYSLAYEKYIDFLYVNFGAGYRLKEAFINDLFLHDYCYCDIESFFDENGIEIIINRNYITKKDIVDLKYYEYSWDYCIVIENERPFHIYNTSIKTRSEAKEAASYKAFEILNNQLKD